MAISNVTSKWVDGNLVFSKADDGTVILTLDAENAAIALGTQADNEADLVDVTGTVEDSDLNTVIATVNALKDALVLGGIMAAA